MDSAMDGESYKKGKLIRLILQVAYSKKYILIKACQSKFNLTIIFFLFNFNFISCRVVRPYPTLSKLVALR